MEIRYLSHFNTREKVNVSYDVIIIGSGIAGLYTALNLEPNLNVLVVTKDTIYETNSNLAQGGIAAAMDESDYHLHIADTLKAGCYYNMNEAVKVIVEEGRENVHRLIELGVNFDKTEEGELKATREGGHSNYRVLHAKDATGREIIRALSEEVHKRANIDVMEYSFAVDIITDNNKCYGVVINKNNETTPYLSKYTVIATGGIGQLYKNSTNSFIASGDGIAMAKRAGVKITDMEFVQFHPTALYTQNKDRNFLISEALRGEGAILRNHAGVAFMEQYHELKDLAPRDIVARAIINEIGKSDKPYLYLDVTHMDEMYLKNRFPNIFNECLTYGIDITQEYIPVCPVQHYLMGGIETNLYGETNMNNLFACGESAKTGSHGANRLASNSLLEAIVFGKRIALKINRDKSDMVLTPLDFESENGGMSGETDYTRFITDIQDMMTKKVFIYRNYDELISAKKEIETIKSELEALANMSISYFKTYNMVVIAQLVIEAALDRNQSIGSHMLLDKGDISNESNNS